MVNRKEYMRNYYLVNQERLRLKKRAYYKKNKSRILEYEVKYRLDHQSEILEYHKKYKRENKDKVNFNNSRRRAKKSLSCPSWLTEEQLKDIKDIYARCTLIQEQTGIKHHVDHIQPLQGKDRSGLHVSWNLQILTASENIAKSNNT